MALLAPDQNHVDIANGELDTRALDQVSYFFTGEQANVQSLLAADCVTVANGEFTCYVNLILTLMSSGDVDVQIEVTLSNDDVKACCTSEKFILAHINMILIQSLTVVTKKALLLSPEAGQSEEHKHSWMIFTLEIAFLHANETYVIQSRRKLNKLSGHSLTGSCLFILLT